MKRVSRLLSVIISAALCGTPTGLLYALESRAIGVFDNPRDTSQLRVNPDLFLRPDLSVGETALLPKDPMQSWKAAHARLWFALPHSDGSGRLFLQTGVGFLQIDPLLQPHGPGVMTPSVLVPFGVGFDYPWNTGRSLTTVLSLDVSDIRSGLQTGTHIAPGLLFGIHF
jgi:hypothetical protein